MFAFGSLTPQRPSTAPLSDARPTVPPAKVEALRAAVADLTVTAAGANMLRAYGGYPHAFERFVIASKDAADAEARFRTTHSFRSSFGIDNASTAGASRDPELRGAELIRSGLVTAELVERVRPLWFGSYAGHSIDGSAIHYCRLRRDPSELRRRCSEEELRRFYVWWMEQQLALQNGRHAPGTAAPAWAGMIDVIDLAGFKFAWLDVPSFQLLARVLAIGQAHYPENLRCAYLLSAPPFFAAGWSVVSAVLSPATRAKVGVLGDADVAQLAGRLERGEARLREIRDGTPEAAAADRHAPSHAAGSGWLGRCCACFQ